MTDTCERANKWFRKCKWQPIYDTKEPSDELRYRIEMSYQLPEWLALLGVIERTYVGARCLTCGKYIPRDSECN